MVMRSSAAGPFPHASDHDLPRQNRRGVRRMVKDVREHGDIMRIIDTEFK
jgi:uncharacterized membrane protein